jgi:hypothetical protein
MKNKKQKELTNKVNELEQKVRLLEQVSRKQTLTTSIILSIIEKKEVTCDEAGKEAPDPEPEPESKIMPKEYGGKMNCKQEEHAEPQPERIIVFDWFIHPERGPIKAGLNPCNFNELKVIAEIGFGKYVFLLTTIHSIHPLIYIGHYKN